MSYKEHYLDESQRSVDSREALQDRLKSANQTHDQVVEGLEFLKYLNSELDTSFSIVREELERVIAISA